MPKNLIDCAHDCHAFVFVRPIGSSAQVARTQKKKTFSYNYLLYSNAYQITFNKSIYTGISAYSIIIFFIFYFYFQFE